MSCACNERGALALILIHAPAHVDGWMYVCVLCTESDTRGQVATLDRGCAKSFSIRAQPLGSFGSTWCREYIYPPIYPCMRVWYAVRLRGPTTHSVKFVPSQTQNTTDDPNPPPPAPTQALGVPPLRDMPLPMRRSRYVTSTAGTCLVDGKLYEDGAAARMATQCHAATGRSPTLDSSYIRCVRALGPR